MNKINVAIMVVGQFINEKIINRFKECIKHSNPKSNYHIHILSSCDGSQQPDQFNKSKLLNKGIKTICNEMYEVVIQTDIDLIVPPGLIDKSYNEAMAGKFCLHANHRRINIEKILNFPKLPEKYQDISWSSMKKFPIEAANGCWNAIQSCYWWDTGGYNEHCVNWSREDDDFDYRAKRYGKIEFITTNDYPLLHINHPPRNIDNRKHNTLVVKKAIEEGKTNWLI